MKTFLEKVLTAYYVCERTLFIAFWYLLYIQYRRTDRDYLITVRVALRSRKLVNGMYSRAMKERIEIYKHLIRHDVRGTLAHMVAENVLLTDYNAAHEELLKVDHDIEAILMANFESFETEEQTQTTLNLEKPQPTSL